VCVNSASTVLRGAGADRYIGIDSATSSAITGGNVNANDVDVSGETGLLDGLIKPFCFAIVASCPVHSVIGSTTYINHEPLGNPRTVTDPNGNSTTYTYDTTGRVTSVKASGDTNATQYFYVSGGSLALHVIHDPFPAALGT